MNFTRNKYRVAPKEQRMYKGQLYASKAEMQYAKELDWQLPGRSVAWWLRQCPVQLTEDDCYRPDFLVGALSGHNECTSRAVLSVHAVDVKGHETRDFKRVKRLWAKYGPFPLHIVKRGKTVEVIERTKESSHERKDI